MSAKPRHVMDQACFHLPSFWGLANHTDVWTDALGTPRWRDLDAEPDAVRWNAMAASWPTWLGADAREALRKSWKEGTPGCTFVPLGHRVAQWTQVWTNLCAETPDPLRGPDGPENGATLLAFAVAHGWTAMVQDLVAAGAPVMPFEATRHDPKGHPAWKRVFEREREVPATRSALALALHLVHGFTTTTPLGVDATQALRALIAAGADPNALDDASALRALSYTPGAMVLIESGLDGQRLVSERRFDRGQKNVEARPLYEKLLDFNHAQSNASRQKLLLALLDHGMPLTAPTDALGVIARLTTSVHGLRMLPAVIARIGPDAVAPHLDATLDTLKRRGLTASDDALTALLQDARLRSQTAQPLPTRSVRQRL